MAWEIEFDYEGLDKWVEEVPLLVRDAINETAEYAMGLLIEGVQKIYNVPSEYITSKVMKLIPASSTLTAEIVISGRPIPLIKMDAVQTGTGVQFMVRRDHGMKSIQHAFIATMPSGHEGVYLRTGRFKFPQAGRYAGASYEREVIEQKVTISLADMIWSNELYAMIEDQVIDYFEESMSRLIDESWDKTAGKAA